jgi:hypothetical protein
VQVGELSEAGLNDGKNASTFVRKVRESQIHG